MSSNDGSGPRRASPGTGACGTTILKTISIRAVTTNTARSRDARRRLPVKEQSGGKRYRSDRDELHAAHHGGDQTDPVHNPRTLALRQAEQHYVQGTKQPDTGRHRATQKSRRREQARRAGYRPSQPDRLSEREQESAGPEDPALVDQPSQKPDLAEVLKYLNARRLRRAGRGRTRRPSGCARPPAGAA